MNLREITAKLSEQATNHIGKFIPWWEDNFSECDYEDQIFTPDEITEVEKSVKSSTVNDLSAADQNTGYSLFHLLVWLNFYDAAKEALIEGVSADLEDGKNLGTTPLLLACSRGNYKMAKLLAAHGANLAHCDAKGRNGFHYLAHPFADGLKISDEPIHSLNQRKEIAKLLASSKANINQKESQGITPIVYLVDGGLAIISATLIDTYLSLGADPHFVSEAPQRR